MLIFDWVQSLGLPSDRKRLRLADVKRFVFGERYFIEMADGRCYQDNDLERLLSVMHDEFHTHNTTVLLRTGESESNEHVYPLVQLVAGQPTARDPLGKHDQRVLQIVPMFNSIFGATSGVLPPPEIEAVVATVRDSITFYNLSGSWESFKKENL